MNPSPPVTLADLKALEKSVLAEFKRVHRSIDEVLGVLVNVNNRLTGPVDNHEKRIQVLERAVLA